MNDLFETEIAIRAYSERPDREPLAVKAASRDLEASPWTLVFDTETTTDATQRLRIGFFQLRNRGRLVQEGVFLDEDALSADEIRIVTDYARTHALIMLTVDMFRREVMLKYGYTRHATVVGFNLPFDLSRIAIGHGPARQHMRGGFSFLLSSNPDDPRVRVKHLSPRASLIDFAKPGKQDKSRGMRKRGIPVATYRGHFVDVKTLGSALLSQRFSLRSLASMLRTRTQKHETEEHGTISPKYLDYARADVQVTWECFESLSLLLNDHGLSKSADRLLSEASVGKGYLLDMGIKPLLANDPMISRKQFGEVFCAYYGGRAEVRNRRVVQEIRYCDFKSMYPTVNTLMGLWGFVIADGYTAEETTTNTQEILNSITVEQLRIPSTWRSLCTLVQVIPDHDLFPVRARYDDQTYTIGLNYLSTDGALWYTLADCIVSKLLTGKAPRIKKALTYKPRQRQGNLRPVKILGHEDYTIDPNKDDLFCRLVDLRDEAKEKGDSIEKALKIIANSTSYGIFIEINRDDAPKSEVLNVFGPNSDFHSIQTMAVEEPGRFFHPLLGVLITGAARLMLGIAEKLAIDSGLDWAFCDTDSLAIVRPKGLSSADFHKKGEAIINWFESLNPYKKKGSILKLEGINFGISSKEIEPLYCFAISSKRYALFNIRNGKPILRKASAHGLGHLIDPYSEIEAPANCPSPAVSLSQIGVKRWHHDLWIKIIQAALDEKPNQVIMNWHPAFSKPAAMRYSASNPGLLAWLNKWNSGKTYSDQIRPFGFLHSFTPRSGVFAPIVEDIFVDTVIRGRPRKRKLAPIAPFSTDAKGSSTEAFDRVTGEKISADQLKTYAEVLAQYHLSCEDKFLNGQFLNCGRTERRRVVASKVVLIGKEANKVGPSGEGHPTHSVVEQFCSARNYPTNGSVSSRPV